MGTSGMSVSRPDAATRWHGVVRIERALLPDLDMPTGIFGSRRDRARIDANDDNQAELMSCLQPFHREG